MKALDIIAKLPQRNCKSRDEFQRRVHRAIHEAGYTLVHGGGNRKRKGRSMKVECDNCGSIFDPEFDKLIPLHEVKHPLQRIEPGGIVPAGECPECGAWVYPVKEVQL